MAIEQDHLRPEDLSEVLSEVRIPLENVKFALEHHLRRHGQTLDSETKLLLTGVHDCVGRIAGSTKGFIERKLAPDTANASKLIYSRS